MHENNLSDEAFDWHNLSSDDVYHIAHLEHEVRDAAASKLARIAFIDDPLEQKRLSNDAKAMITNHEARATSWFRDQLGMRGLLPLSKETIAAEWLEEEFEQTPGVYAKDIARLAGVSPGYLSEIRKGNKQPSHEVKEKLIKAFEAARRDSSN